MSEDVIYATKLVTLVLLLSLGLIGFILRLRESRLEAREKEKKP